MHRQLVPAAAIAALAIAVALPASAPAAAVHVVQPGETLWSIAAANNHTTRSIAAFNGLSEDAPLVDGTTVRIPAPGEYSYAPPAGSATSTTATSTTTTADQSSAGATGAGATTGGHLVRPGETLSGIAAANGVSAAQLAAHNGLAPDHHVIEGTRLSIPSASAGDSSASQTTYASTSGSTAAGDSTATSDGTTSTTDSAATPTVVGPRVDPATVGQIAAANGVPASLAKAIAHQESGFNNAAVSSTNARGVMQVMPGTWEFIQQKLASRALDQEVASDNITAGSLYLKRLRALWGNDDLAIASYYQGPGSVKRIGMLPETQRYVENVRALRARYGG